MCNRKLSLVGALVGSMIAAALSSESNAQGAPVPVIKSPPPSAGPPQPTPAAGAQPASPAGAAVTVTLHCGVAGISTDLFSTSGLRCPSPVSPGKCTYVILAGWNPAPALKHDPRFDKLDFTSTYTGTDMTGFYVGTSSKPGNIATFQTPDRKVCVSNFPTTEGWVPESTELIVRGPFPCL